MTTLISRDELRSAIETGTVVVVDTLGGDYYAQQHLPGAIALVESEVADRAAELLPAKDATVVTYCSNPACGNSEAVARRLTALGYTDVRKYREGIQDWVEAGLPVETGAGQAIASGR
ncbi:rhodanese-like domain-containing protein [Planobispora longispora]|uniref:Sulfurtransferase n=1 Tax=Planobispora longispora TaxID=28887 RepID=A0A8J3RR87_9ACTN|nr:rhodanese-like domain-containing protein [Planobispora longispora]BFE88361.1 rhodanese-like domain-containing protein [Planobispora longispora]GIH79673.1 sulfurtransferase [Planobispora longispora]